MEMHVHTASSPCRILVRNYLSVVFLIRCGLALASNAHVEYVARSAAYSLELATNTIVMRPVHGAPVRMEFPSASLIGLDRVRHGGTCFQRAPATDVASPCFSRIRYVSVYPIGRAHV